MKKKPERKNTRTSSEELKPSGVVILSEPLDRAVDEAVQRAENSQYWKDAQRRGRAHDWKSPDQPEDA
jgi:hypothetical protein